MLRRPIAASIQCLAFITQVTLLSIAYAVESPSDSLDLSGQWSICLDPKDVGISEQWADADFGDAIDLPGSLQSQGYGNEVSTLTKWTGAIMDRSWFDAPEYAKYRRPGNVKVPYWLQSNWNGMIGRMELRASDPVWIDDLQVYPDVENNRVRVKVVFGNLTKNNGNGTMTVQAVRGDGKNDHSIAEIARQVNIGSEDRTIVEFDYPMGKGVALWDEFAPALYRMIIRSDIRIQGATSRSESTTTFGMRHLTTDGTQFVLNGHPIFLRGTLECCIFPKTGYPPTDVDSWKRIIGICKAHGLNHIRFHSWCPPEAAFVAADELGFYFQVECAAWANVDDDALGRFIYAEGDRILREYGNHPSFILLAYGNEPGGKVLLLKPPSQVRGNVAIGFSSIFWNTAWTHGQAPHTLGILCDPRHPALASFPTEYHSNWQWSDLIRHSAAMVLDRLPPDVRPLVQPIDTWFKNRRLGLIFEAHVEEGKLLVCSIDLQSNLDKRPVARQMRHALLKYMASEKFTPKQKLTIEQVRDLFKEPT